jgi:uncharacterized protein (DUF488 family)
MGGRVNLSDGICNMSLPKKERISAVEIFTIGYEGVTLDMFLSCLAINKIEFLADVRENPFSRKPGFSKKALTEAVSRRYIKYWHFPRLGCPLDIRNVYAKSRDWNQYCDSYNEHLHANPDAVNELVALLKKFRCALMCFEANPYLCHRFLIAQQIEKQHSASIKNLSPMSFPQITITAEAVPCFV